MTASASTATSSSPSTACPELPGAGDDVDLLLPIAAAARECFAYDSQDCVPIKRVSQRESRRSAAFRLGLEQSEDLVLTLEDLD